MATQIREMENTMGQEKKCLHYFAKMKGGKAVSKHKVSWEEILVTTGGSLAGLGVVVLLAHLYHLPLLLPSLGASAVLLYASCHVPMAQPRNLVGGHMISAFIGVMVYMMLGAHWWNVAIAVTAAIVAMVLTRTLHPPGGATAFVAVYNQQGLDFVIMPVAIGVICLLLIALLVNNLSKAREYPQTWL